MFEPVNGLLTEAVASGVFPGTSICVRSGTTVFHRFSVGRAEIRPEVRIASDATVWDVASLTKALATTPIAMALVDAGLLDLDAPVNAVLHDAVSGVTARHLLSHTSGLPPWLAMAERLGLNGAGTDSVREEVLRIARTTPLQSAPGTKYAYSDLGFLTLCSLIEELGGLRLDGLYERYVREPSGVDMRFGWPTAAATEECPVRGSLVRGEVHDLNAWLMGGVSSHAGLFGTADAVAASAAWQLRAWQGTEGSGVSPDVVRHFWGARAVGSHHLGWDGVSPNGSAGPYWPKDGVGHLGFTGCSVWIAPRQDLVVAWTTNRVHPEIEGGAVPDAPMSERHTAFKRLRPKLHTAVVEVMKQSSRWPL
jgi:CubicO group peptidase (beta-lactamase class C family)